MFKFLLAEKNSFIFESVEKGKIKGRYTIFGKNPDKIWEFNNNNSYLIKNKKTTLENITKTFHANEGYLNIALRVLCSQGWLEQHIDNSTDEIYFNDSPHWIDVGVDATNTRIVNNLINKPDPAATSYLRDASGSAVAANNLFVDDAGFVDGFNSNVLDRNYRLREDSPAVGAGTPVSILDDYANTLRNGVYDVGAYVYAGIQQPVDTDGDGINDDYERQLGTDPNDASDTPADLDVDGIPDGVDSDRDGDGVYDKDPVKYKDAKLFKELTYNEVLSKELKVMDTTAVVLCKENNIPLRVFNMLKKGSLMSIINGENTGTIIK